MASAPTFKPSVYVGRLDPAKLAPLLDLKAAAKANYPGLDRAVEGVYPAGSIFKPSWPRLTKKYRSSSSPATVTSRCR